MILFKTIRWKNFLSTGNVFTEIDLTSNKTNLIIGSNGAGKSTILDALTFSLFGKPFRKINKPMLVNSINDKDCLTEIEFLIGKNEFKIRRGIKPAIFEVYQNGLMIDQSSSAVDYQRQLEQNILKMNYKSFTQIVVLGSSTFVPFMRLPLAARREIIEDILDIQIFSVMNQNLKEKVKQSSAEISNKEYEIDKLDVQYKSNLDFLQHLETKKENDIVVKQEKVHVLLSEEKEYVNQIDFLNEEVLDITSKITELSGAGPKLKKLNNLKGKIQQKFNGHKKDHKFFTENTTCPTCSQHINEDVKEEKLSSILSAIKELNKGFQEIEQAITDEEEREENFIQFHTQLNNTNSEIYIKNTIIRNTQTQIQTLQEEIESLRTNTKDDSNIRETLKTCEGELVKMKNQYSLMKKEKDCLSAASQLLKDNGIKTRIIKRYLPAMNKLINNYLQSMDFYVNFTLDENFEETIKSRYRDIFSYESFSEGEKARIDIALLLTWRSIAKLKNSVDTNLLILDEIFDGSLDQNGTGELGWILKNFDDNTNVFVISHKENLNDKFDRTITFEKVKNYSVPRVTVAEVD
jgi:DNA repair exonuclease SbcCD ATPase subunit